MLDPFPIIPIGVNGYYYKGKTPEGRANKTRGRPTNKQSSAENIKMSTDFQKGDAQMLLSHFVLLDRKSYSISQRKKGPRMDETALYHDRIAFKDSLMFQKVHF